MNEVQMATQSQIQERVGTINADELYDNIISIEGVNNDADTQIQQLKSHGKFGGDPLDDYLGNSNMNVHMLLAAILNGSIDPADYDGIDGDGLQAALMQGVEANKKEFIKDNNLEQTIYQFLASSPESRANATEALLGADGKGGVLDREKLVAKDVGREMLKDMQEGSGVSEKEFFEDFLLVHREGGENFDLAGTIFAVDNPDGGTSVKKDDGFDGGFADKSRLDNDKYYAGALFGDAYWNESDSTNRGAQQAA